MFLLLSLTARLLSLPALTRDHRIAMTVKSTAPSRRSIDVYSAAGFLLVSMPWDKGHVVALGWTDQEDLVVVQEDGMIMLYNVFERKFLSQFSMGQVHRFPTFFLAMSGFAPFTVARLLTNVAHLAFRKPLASQPSAAAGVAQAKLAPGGRGLVILTNDNRFYSVANFADPKVACSLC